MKTKKQTMGRISAMLGLAFTIGAGAMNQAQAQLYISEYAEGSGNNKCVEIYYCGTDAIDLSCWQYRAFHNGSSTPTYTIDLDNLQDSLDTNDRILVICNPAAAANGSLTIANVDLFSNSIQHNGNDAVAIYNTCTGTYSDIFGQATSTSNFAANNTWRRNCPVTTANTFPGTNSTSNWTTQGNNNLAGFGAVAACADCPTAGTGEVCEFRNGELSCPIITGYLEGSSLNKCVEISNPTCDTICLSNIEYRAYHNGATVPNYRITLSTLGQDFLLPGESFTICNPDADSLTLLVADTTWSGIQHNGNDALVLWNFDQNGYCDIFGNIGEDSTWIADCSGDTFRTYNTNLSRQTTVCSGITADPSNGSGFPTLCTEWDQDTALNSTAGLGSHDLSFCLLINGCAPGKKGADRVEVLSSGEMSVYPNPANTAATFEFSMSEDQNVTIEVFTITGVKVAQPFNGRVEKDVTNRANFDVSGLAAGTYIYRLSAGDNTKVGNITVLK